MSTFILLDSGPLGLVTNPKATGETFLCYQWAMSHMQRGHLVMVPEIADYEVRRELIRAGKLRGLVKLDRSKVDFGYLPLTTAAMLLAAELWAESRRFGRPSSSDDSLDADVILAAQAVLLKRAGHQVVVATTNPKHLQHFVDARRWSDIT